MIDVVEKSDCGELAALHARCFPRGWSAMEIAPLAAQPNSVAFKAGKMPIHGFILVRHAAGEAEILTLAVDPDRRRNGLAKRLVTRAEATVRAFGCGRFFLEVSERNEAARALYDRLGFRVTGMRPVYYADGSDARVMEKSLPQ